MKKVLKRIVMLFILATALYYLLGDVVKDNLSIIASYDYQAIARVGAAGLVAFLAIVGLIMLPMLPEWWERQMNARKSQKQSQA